MIAHPNTTARPDRGVQRYHMIMDVKPWRLQSIDRDVLFRLLVEIPGLIGMKILLGPSVVEGSASNPGLTGFVVIDFSHISIHTFSEYRQIMIDIFSCREYDRAVVENYVRKQLEIGKEAMTVKIVDWGQHAG